MTDNTDHLMRTPDGKILANLHFRVKEFSHNRSNMAVEICECVEYPELAIARERKRFLWTERYFVLKGEAEHEFPTLKDAFIEVLKDRGAGGPDA